jgi:hypothetical protein
MLYKSMIIAVIVDVQVKESGFFRQFPTKRRLWTFITNLPRHNTGTTAYARYSSTDLNHFYLEQGSQLFDF